MKFLTEEVATKVDYKVYIITYYGNPGSKTLGPEITDRLRRKCKERIGINEIRLIESNLLAPVEICVKKILGIIK